MNYLRSYFASKKWIEKQAEAKGMQKAISIINKMIDSREKWVAKLPDAMKLDHYRATCEIATLNEFKIEVQNELRRI